MCIDEWRRMRVLRRRRIQDYQLHSTNDPNDTKPFDDIIDPASVSQTTELDDITLNVSRFASVYLRAGLWILTGWSS